MLSRKQNKKILPLLHKVAAGVMFCAPGGTRHKNESGCSVFVSVRAEEKNCVISVEDNGKGAVDEQIEKLNNTPHYMVCDSNTKEQRHGLGLLIVKQIAASHGGNVTIGHSGHGGFAVRIRMPVI